MVEELLQKIENLYGVKIFSTKQIRGVHCLHTDQGDLCLKKIEYNLKKFLFIYHAMEHLLEHNFKQLPAFIHTLTGEPYFNFQEENYFLSEWLSGRECNFKNPVDLEIALVTLARMHRFSKGFQPPGQIKQRSRLEIWPDRLKKRTANLKKFKELAINKTNPTKIDRYFLKHINSKLADCKKAIKLIDTPIYRNLVKKIKDEGSFCHNDFVYHNVLINDQESYKKPPKAYILDFDYCRYDLRVYDLARVIRRIIKEKKYQNDFLDIILSAYNSEYPLETEEYQILAGFLQFPQRFWRIADRYYNQKQAWSEKKYYTQMKNSVRRFQHRKRLIKEILSYEKKDY